MTLQCATIDDAYSAGKGMFTDCLRNAWVGGSSPLFGTNDIKNLRRFARF
jgi:hypothetical protein